MLRVSLSIILLAGLTVATPVARSAANDPIQKLTIKGSVTYEDGAALPPGSQAVIELRHRPALPDAPAVAYQRIDLEGKESPESFEFTLERYKLVGGVTYFVRGTIVSGKSAIWTADDIKIDVTQSTGGRERDHAEAGKGGRAGPRRRDDGRAGIASIPAPTTRRNKGFRSSANSRTGGASLCS